MNVTLFLIQTELFNTERNPNVKMLINFQRFSWLHLQDHRRRPEKKNSLHFPRFVNLDAINSCLSLTDFFKMPPSSCFLVTSFPLPRFPHLLEFALSFVYNDWQNYQWISPLNPLTDQVPRISFSVISVNTNLLRHLFTLGDKATSFSPLTRRTKFHELIRWLIGGWSE